MKSKKYIKFKHKKDEELFLFLTPILIHVAGDMANYCHKRGLPFIVTDTISTLENDKEIKRVSSSHRQGRAIDVSVHGWMKNEIKDFMEFYSNKYRKIAAISKEDLKPKLIVYHNHIGWHMHIQLHPDYAVVPEQ